jgi:AcrR family transcriptional regulator
VPRNNRAIDRDERVDRLVKAAAEEFLGVGYAGTTMTHIARRAGVTGSALYWYFDSKDEALAVVQERVLASTLARVEQHGGTAMERLQLFLEILRAEARPLHRMLHERSPHSGRVSAVLDEIHSVLDQLIRGAVHERNAEFDELDTIVSLAMAVIEGTSAVTAPEHSSQLVSWAIERLVPVMARP